MKYPIAAAGVALLSFALPLITFASTSCSGTNPKVCTTPAASPGGVTIYSSTGDDAEGNVEGSAGAAFPTSAWFSTLANDVQDNYDTANIEGDVYAPPSDSQLSTTGIWAGATTDSFNFVTGYATTLNRLCNDLDTNLGPNPNAQATYADDRTYASTDNNQILLFNGSLWRWQASKGSSNHHLGDLTCASYALPSQSLWTSVDTPPVQSRTQTTSGWGGTVTTTYYNMPQTKATTINLGQSFNINWSSSERDEAFAPISTSPKSNPAVSYPTSLQAQCTTSGFDVPTQTQSLCLHQNVYQLGGFYCDGNTISYTAPQACAFSSLYYTPGYQNLLDSGGSGNATGYPPSDFHNSYPNSCSVQAGGTSTTNPPPYSLSITPTHAGEYTYKYTCTSPNGTTEDSVTVTVLNPSPLPDLIADSTSPATTTAGVPTALSSLISNTGPVGTGTGFPNLFEISSTSNPASFAALDAKVAASPASSALGNATSTTPSATATASYTFPTPGTWYVRACADTDTTNNASTPLSTDGVNHTGAVVESDESNNCGQTGLWTPITVNPNQPNLTAGNINQGSVDTATDVSLSANILNTGAASTNAGFTNLFEVESDADYNGDPVNHNTVTAYRTGPSGTLAGGASAVSTAATTYRFPSAGTWHLRACADESAPGGPGTITESNEGDNCGNWTTISVTTPTAPSGCWLKANPTSVQSGGQTTLTWSSTGASSCTGTGFSTGGATNNQVGVSVSPTTNPTNYSITCSNSAGSCTQPVSVPIGPTSCTAVPITLTAAPTRVKQGSSVTFTYTIPQVAAGVTQCTITASGFTPYSIPVSSCVVTGGPTGTAPSGAITTQTTFTLTCGSAVTTATVDVLPAIIED